MRRKKIDHLETQCPMMQRFLPKFKTFLSDSVGINRGQFDFIVPVESKGAALFDWAYGHNAQDLFSPTIIYPRAFDFIPQNKLHGKKVALIDDICFSGRTLRRLKTRLERHGLLVKTFAFAIDDTETTHGDRDEDLRSQTPSAISLHGQEYALYLSELRYWSSHSRIPSSYDHLVFTIPTFSIEELEALLSFFHGHGEVLDYGKRSSYHCWAAIFPEPCHWIGPHKTVQSAVPPKFRMWYDHREKKLIIVPMWCAVSGQGYKNSYTDIIASHNSDEEAKLRDDIDSLSLAGRTNLLSPVFHKFSKIRDSAKLEIHHLDRTFTPTVRRLLEGRLRLLLKEWSCVGSYENTVQEPSTDGLVVPFRSLANTIRNELRKTYEEQLAPRHERETRGYTVSELLNLHRAERPSVHAAVDFLLDFGYATTCFAKTAASPFTRALRTTEVQQPFTIEKLAAAYIALTNNKMISSTEGAKLVPILADFCGEQVESCKVKRSPMGRVGVMKYGRDEEDVLDVLKKSSLLKVANTDQGRFFTLNQDNYNNRDTLNDPAVKPLYGRLSGLATVVHNLPSDLTPSERATLFTLLGGEQFGLEQICEDAEIIAGQFGEAYNKLIDPQPSFSFLTQQQNISRYLDAMGLAHAAAAQKIKLLRNAERFISELQNKLTDIQVAEQVVLEEARVPQRWKFLIDIISWYLEQNYSTSLAILACKQGRIDDEDLEAALVKAWPIGPRPIRPFDRWLRQGSSFWRKALFGPDPESEKTPSDLRKPIDGINVAFAHYDLYNSSLQKKNRSYWLGFAANMINSWAILYGSKLSNSWETQAESGFIWSENPRDVLYSVMWCIYSLYVMSEIKKLKDKRVQQEWIPVFCLCVDSAENDAIGTEMAHSAKITKRFSRAEAEDIAAKARYVKRNIDSLEERVFLLGKQLTIEFVQTLNIECNNASTLASELGIESELVMLPLRQNLQIFLLSLPNNDDLLKLLH